MLWRRPENLRSIHVAKRDRSAVASVVTTDRHLRDVKGITMPSRTIRSPLVLAVIASIGVATAAAPAQAFTPPIGTDKSSIVVTKPSGMAPAADGIIAVLIGLVRSNDGP
jgi:hypothetical protein